MKNKSVAQLIAWPMQWGIEWMPEADLRGVSRPQEFSQFHSAKARRPDQIDVDLTYRWAKKLIAPMIS